MLGVIVNGCVAGDFLVFMVLFNDASFGFNSSKVYIRKEKPCQYCICTDKVMFVE
jgi:hypothetical protein